MIITTCFGSWLGLKLDGLAWLDIYSAFEATIELLWTNLGNSQHLNPSNWLCKVEIAILQV
eukprot:scaffold150037_cov36-Cyclotella_meneghiniana.AAC.1